MTLSAILSSPSLMNELAQARQRLVNMRATLMQVCRDLDAQITSLDSVSAPVASADPFAAPAPVSLFEYPPANIQQAPAADTLPASTLVIKAAAPAALDPKLERATLEELNSALSKAFSQIAGRSQW